MGYSALNYFSNPWAFLILLYLLYRIYRWISPMESITERYYSWQEKREQAADAAAMKKDPDAYRAKMEAMEAARMRMQEKYNQDADAEQLKREEAEALRREQDIRTGRSIKEVEAIRTGLQQRWTRSARPWSS